MRDSHNFRHACARSRSTVEHMERPAPPLATAKDKTSAARAALLAKRVDKKERDSKRKLSLQQAREAKARKRDVTPEAGDPSNANDLGPESEVSGIVVVRRQSSRQSFPPKRLTDEMNASVVAQRRRDGRRRNRIV